MLVDPRLALGWRSPLEADGLERPLPPSARTPALSGPRALACGLVPAAAGWAAAVGFGG